MLIPSLIDWGDISDRDISSSYKNFGGKSNDEMQNKFKENILERCSDLRWMPIKPFVYYIYGLKQFIETEDFGLFARASSADGLFDLILDKSNQNQQEIKEIYKDFFPILKKISENQSFYELEEDIYGNFSKKLDEINSILSK